MVEAVANVNSSPKSVFAALLEPGKSLAKRLKAFGERLVSSEANRRVVLLDLLLNILGRGLIQELELHPGSLEVEDVTRMLAQLAPATNPPWRLARAKLTPY